MALAQPLARLSEQEYLQIERAAQHKSEFFDGEMFAMAGGTPQHSLIAANLIAAFQNALKGKPCAATADYLSRVNGIHTPLWAQDEARVLEEPWFSEDGREVRLLLLRDTPSAFKEKNVFVFDTALNVA